MGFGNLDPVLSEPAASVLREEPEHVVPPVLPPVAAIDGTEVDRPRGQDVPIVAPDVIRESVVGEIVRLTSSVVAIRAQGRLELDDHAVGALNEPVAAVLMGAELRIRAGAKLALQVGLLQLVLARVRWSCSAPPAESLCPALVEHVPTVGDRGSFDTGVSEPAYISGF